MSVIANPWLVPPPYDAEPDDKGAALLAEWAAAQPTDPDARVLILGAGAGGVGLPLARQGARVTFADDHVSALAAARRTFSQARLSADFVSALDLPAEPAFDLALLNIVWWSDAERGAELIALAAGCVRPGGIVAVAGGKQSGIGGAERDLAALLGSASAVAYGKGHRVVAARKRAPWTPPEPHPAEPLMIAIGDQSFAVERRAGVFAGGGLDDASRMLIEAIAAAPAAAGLAGARVLDLGCGAGLVGMALARREPAIDLTLLDSNVVAIDVAAANCRRNAVAARVLGSDGVEAVADEAFDLVAINPPFHIGRIKTEALAHRLIKESWGVLRPGGSLWLVANRFLRYEPVVAAAFGNVAEAAGDTRYKVLVGVKPLETP